ncbi:NfeD family protein [Clostridium sp. MCC353]|uniref:NfeD family protein n=1 Tax=Clostridium sp. MCC353 TaxID=2592646 RepID=UPI001C011758|nr:NfeD family protein [Clostridium sp. MCC353]MBT9779123.1 NfeD family protein [Clostridium sp. MCC353]
MATIFWLAALVIFVVIELATLALTTIWFAGGALAAFILSLLHFSVEVQLVTFVVVSFILLFGTRPFAAKYINRTTVKTNVEGLIGKTARVTSEVNNDKETGTAVVNGQEWTARAVEEDEVYPPGTMVMIKEVRGVKLIVSKAQEEA